MIFPGSLHQIARESHEKSRGPTREIHEKSQSAILFDLKQENFRVDRLMLNSCSINHAAEADKKRREC